MMMYLNVFIGWTLPDVFAAAGTATGTILLRPDDSKYEFE